MEDKKYKSFIRLLNFCPEKYSQEQVFKDFAHMASQGLTVLMVTHDVHAVNYATDVYTLENRKLLKTK